ncbi:MAG: two-component regulator propeller domain-containing protein, partial [Flavobacteriales bacterium]|nr:two-component regulator propeller domain-containing protein [Flavobacteriales bacterium]
MARARLLARGAALALAAWPCAAGTAQQHSFLQLAPRDGLAQSQVRAMAQDAEGYLWFGTLGGASRFDGHGFRSFALQEGLPDAHVSALATDAAGHLWMGAGDALVRMAGDRPVREELPGTTGARIQDLATDPAGRLFIGTDGDGLFVRDSTGIARPPGYPADTASHVRCLLPLSDGRLLVGLRNGLLLWEQGAFRAVSLGAGEARAVSALAEGADGTWWAGTFHDGLFHLDDQGVIAVYDEENNLLQNTVRCLLVDDRGRLWAGTKLGLNLLDKGRMRVFTIHQGMPNDNVWCAMQDDEGNIWFGTDGGGALKYAGDRFVTFTVRDGLCSDLVMNITADARGDLWIGTYDNGVCRLDAMAMITTIDGLPNNTVWSGLCARDGTLWFGTSDGVARIRQGVVQPLAEAARLRGHRVFSLYEDEQGNIWAGTRHGLARIGTDQQVVHHPAGDKGPGRSVRAIVSPAPGRFWLATEQGISELGPEG